MMMRGDTFAASRVERQLGSVRDLNRVDPCRLRGRVAGDSEGGVSRSVMASLVVDVELEKADGTKVAGASLKDCPLVAYYYSAHW